MNSDGVRQNDLLIEIIRDQIEYLMAMVVRPVVQQQLLVILLILVISWLLPETSAPMATKTQWRGQPIQTRRKCHEANVWRRLCTCCWRQSSPSFSCTLPSVSMRVAAFPTDCWPT